MSHRSCTVSCMLVRLALASQATGLPLLVVSFALRSPQHLQSLVGNLFGSRARVVNDTTLRRPRNSHLVFVLSVLDRNRNLRHNYAAFFSKFFNVAVGPSKPNSM